MYNLPKDNIILQIGDLVKILQSWMVQYSPVARVIEFHTMIQFYVDCYLYGTIYEEACSDPLEDVFIELGIPTDYRRYVKATIKRMVAEHVDRSMGVFAQTDYTYVVQWYGATLGVLTTFGMYNSKLPPTAKQRYDYGMYNNDLPPAAKQRYNYHEVEMEDLEDISI